MFQPQNLNMLVMFFAAYARNFLFSISDDNGSYLPRFKHATFLSDVGADDKYVLRICRKS
jgi:hypothetical protein